MKHLQQLACIGVAMAVAVVFVSNCLVADEIPTASIINESQPSLNDPLPLDGEAADDLDALLDLADEDFGRVAQVDVSAPSLNVEVTTVSRKKSTVGRSPAAVTVISSEMIRRSGATNIPDVLRMVPGVQVARISSHQWAVTIRGFNGLYSNKLQVQIDGRSVYTALYGGVFWSAQNLPLTEIERIEIIRGPGASVWGANAVNGIINIITKRADDTQGWLVQGGTGTQERGFATVRYGTELAEGVYSRVYGSGFDRDHGYTPSGLDHDDWQFGRAGFRIDAGVDTADQFTLVGDFYDGETGTATNLPNTTGPPFAPLTTGTTQFTGGDVLFRWQHEINSTSNTALQVYYDRSEFDAVFDVTRPSLISSVDVFDIDFQHQLEFNDRNSVVWGLGFQHVSSDITNTPGFIEFSRSHRDFQRVSGFLQDEITLSPEQLFLTVGTKLSNNSFSGTEVQPTARLLWLPDERHSVWAAVSRAVRVPTIVDMDGSVTLPPVSTVPIGVFPQQIPGPGLQGQEMMAYEMGIRGQPIDELSWDLTTFINRYENLGDGPLLGFTPVPGNPLAALVLQQRANGGAADAYGTELTATWMPSDQMKITGSYSVMQIFGALDTLTAAPHNQLYMQSSFDFSKNWEGDVTWRYVDTVPGVAPHYNAIDLRLGWKPSANFEWTVVARNLLADKHLEFGYSPIGQVGSLVPAEVFSYITWKF